MVDMLKGIEDNGQTYERGRAALDHQQVKTTADVLAVDLKPYVKFTKAL